MNALVYAGEFALLSKQYTSQLPSVPRGLWTFYTLESLTQCHAFQSSHTFPLHDIRRGSRVTCAHNQRVYGVCAAPIGAGFGLFLFPRSQKIFNFRKTEPKMAQMGPELSIFMDCVWFFGFRTERQCWPGRPAIAPGE